MSLSFRRSAITVSALAVVLSSAISAPPTASAAESVTLTGHGYGHGRGLGQYGALGYALDKGWGYARILDHFYGGTTAGNVGNPEMTVRLTAQDAASSVTVTSSIDFWVGDSSGALRVPGGQAATVARNGSGWTVSTRAGGCSGAVTGGPAALPAVPEVAPTAAAGSDPRALLTLCGNGKGYRGKLRFVVDGSTTRLVNVLSTEEYLRGVVPRESPASWGDLGDGRGIEALRAQSVAARSYAISENRTAYAKTCDTTSCQVYGGAALNGRWFEDPRTDRAIADTHGVVRLRGGAVVRTEFSSSTGGHTAGGAFAAVPDEGDSRSPYHDWTVTISGSAIAAAYPAIGEFRALRVTARNGLGADGGRVTAVDVVGTAGTVSTTGSHLRSKLALRSDWFTPVGPDELWSELRNGWEAGRADHSVWFGGPGSTALACDFVDAGRDQLVAYQNGTWSVRASLESGPADKSFQYGAAGWTPVCGDWDGDGRDGVGVYDGAGTWYLRNHAGPGAADQVIRYGWSGAAPVVGDWNGDGRTTIGVWDRATGTWMVRQSNSPGAPDVQFQYGFAGAVPVAGDLTGDGRTDVGVYAGGTWYLRGSFTPGAADRVFSYGLSTDRPVVGNWDGLGGDGIGVSRPGRR